eukprot:CAMPEP_0197489134 /NCGR_PEP_ID=MMETSP1311-20131121/3990_1 /TAXON_ID=464262 /ORGANISM="Genus nov. species nov., Strain RCC856" /LENGTH=50 /DNA_ID=CAMNT_0043033387 /DNA_START=312 /DNA_END=464 /DNA_ORIENTATION=+
MAFTTRVFGHLLRHHGVSGDELPGTSGGRRVLKVEKVQAQCQPRVLVPVG